MRKTILALLFVLALTGCGYRAPMHPSYLPVVTDSTLYAGIRIYEWQDHMMHAKQYLCDDYLTIIGSTNMDNLSLFLNYEMLAFLYDERICHRAAETFLHDLDAHCREITLEEVKRWPSPRKWRNWILRILGGPLA